MKNVTEHGWSIRLHKIIERLFESPVTTIPQSSKMLDITYPTAQRDIKNLRKINVLVESEEHKRPKIFFAPEIIQIAYRDIFDE